MIHIQHSITTHTLRMKKTTILFIALLLVSPRTSLQIVQFLLCYFLCICTFLPSERYNITYVSKYSFFRTASHYYIVHVRFKIESFEWPRARTYSENGLYKVIVSILNLQKILGKNSEVTNDFVLAICNERYGGEP